MCEVTIIDTGDKRRVMIKGSHHTFEGKSEYSEFETFYSEKFLKKLFEVKKEWMKDEIDRLDNPNYIEGPFSRVLSTFSIDLKNNLVLDFGCGSGASSIILTKLGAAHVVGVDINHPYLEIASRRAEEHMLNRRIQLCRISSRAEIPFKNYTFNVVICNGVLEHIHPQHRKQTIRKLWDIIREGGYLVITETPNRLWPYDSHTTKLWFISYLPLNLAKQYALLFKRVGPNESIDELLSRGLRGMTYWEIIGAIQNGLIECNKYVAYLPFSNLSEDTKWRFLRIGLRFVFKILDRVIMRSLGLHAWMFLPYLTICIKKAVKEKVSQIDHSTLVRRYV